MSDGYGRGPWMGSSEIENPEARTAETKAAGLVKGISACNRIACQRPLMDRGIRWWNMETKAWYCQPCAFRINQNGTLCVREDEWHRVEIAALEQRIATLESALKHIKAQILPSDYFADGLTMHEKGPRMILALCTQALNP